MTEFIDLSHAIEDGMMTYTGLPGPVISDHLSRQEARSHYAEGTTFQIGKIEMVANTGTGQGDGVFSGARICNCGIIELASRKVAKSQRKNFLC